MYEREKLAVYVKSRIVSFFSMVDYDMLRLKLTLYATHAHLAVLCIEVTACVTILVRILRCPPARGALSHMVGSAANQA